MSELNFSIPFEPFTPTAPNFRNLTGRRFERYLVFGLYGKSSHGDTLWLCRCDCGQWRHVVGKTLTRHISRSCGCLRTDTTRTRSIKHGQTVGRGYTVEYQAYQAAKTRCQNPNIAGYDNYGGRGIEFRFESFEEFYAELGKRPSAAHSIERIDNEGHYEKGNVKWATRSEQNRNSRNTRLITINGDTRCLRDWCDYYHISQTSVERRCKKGWDIIRAITTPPRPY